jgi:hypothetical protein
MRGQCNVRRCTFLLCPGRGAAFFTLLRRAGTVTDAGAWYGPGSAKRRRRSAASRPGHGSHRAFDPRDLDLVAEAADAQDLLPLTDG